MNQLFQGLAVALVIMIIVTQCNGGHKKEEPIDQSYVIDSLKRELNDCKKAHQSVDFGNELSQLQQEKYYTTKKQKKQLSEIDILTLRKKDPNHIYQTKGRIRTAEDEAFDQRVQDYIDDNYEEILDQHGR